MQPGKLQLSHLSVSHTLRERGVLFHVTHTHLSQPAEAPAIRAERGDATDWQTLTSSKQVSWLLSRDGDVSVTIIGEVDEFRSSKVLQNHMNRVLSDNSNCIQTEDLLPGRDAQQLSIKDDAKLPLTDVNKQEDPGSPINQSSEEEAADCSTDEDPKDPDDDDSSGNVIEVSLNYRPHFRGSLLLRSHQSEAERVTPQDGETRRRKETSENEGRVAHLKNAFVDDACSKPPACKKPPIPVKPAHLLKSGMALVH
ncbi:uncharacterized protein zgc:92242 [Gambusia affinis]|uniref:uncharacterized protein zgc:92242 n=1 Tax=Gambusia affinis TaxID=33528 RepID=UPI001CDC8D1F|nr:uncharacterized protein zgc:92242 [Gambusia affinis]